jgi:hypothetical protein
MVVQGRGCPRGPGRRAGRVVMAYECTVVLTSCRWRVATPTTQSTAHDLMNRKTEIRTSLAALVAAANAPRPGALASPTWPVGHLPHGAA